DDLAAVGVRLADHGALGDGDVLEQGALHLERPDPVGGRQDHVVRPASEPEVAVLVTDRPVAGHVPVATVDGRRLLGRVPVSGEQRGRVSAQGDVALLAGWALLAVEADYAYVVARRGEPHRPGPDLRAREVADQQRVLGLPVAVVNRPAERVLERSDHL